ncbi:MAG: DUF512 domain-containing protein [Acidimicrobiia bacterium]
MSSPHVLAVAPGSPAERSGLLVGDEIITMNGEAPRDVIRFKLLGDEPFLELEVRRGGLERVVEVDKRAGVPLGVEVHSAVFDRVRTCDNHCAFCFIYQLPPGMRKSLYLKDDDYRLSFLYGNFTTLTRFTEADLERVIDEALGPLYVSIHATDPEVRSKMLRNRRGGMSLRWLRLLLDQGVDVHGQVVVCPGVNDAEILEDTMLGVLDRFPELCSVGLVPLGVSDYNREPEMRQHGVDEAEAVLRICHRWQDRFLQALGRRMVFAADEYYLMIGASFPEVEEYEGFPQHENGIGASVAFGREVEAALENRGSPNPPKAHGGGFFAWADGVEGAAAGSSSSGGWPSVGAPPDGYRAKRIEVRDVSQEPAPAHESSASRSAASMPGAPVRLLTGEYGALVLAPLLSRLSEAAGTDVTALAVPNRFFGGNIAVTGLLTGADLDPVLGDQSGPARYLLPDVALSKGLFLDGTGPDQLCRPVEVVATQGAALVGALRR